MKKIVFTVLCGMFILMQDGYTQSPIYGAFGEVIEQVPVITTNSPTSQYGPISINKRNDEKGEPLTKDVQSRDQRYLIYKVEILTTRSPLDVTHPIFKKFGNITYSQDDLGHFTYYTGEFDEEDEAKNFLAYKVSNWYPNSRLVKERKYATIPTGVKSR